MAEKANLEDEVRNCCLDENCCNLIDNVYLHLCFEFTNDTNKWRFIKKEEYLKNFIGEFHIQFDTLLGSQEVSYANWVGRYFIIITYYTTMY